MTKVLIIDNSQGITGAFKTIFHVANSLKSHFEFHFVSPKGNDQLGAIIKENGHHHQHINFIEISKSWSVILYLPMLLLNSWRLLQYIKRNNISVIHVNDFYNMTGVIIKLRYPSIKLIYHVRLLSSSYAGALYKFWVRIIGEKSDRIIVVSDCVHSQVLKFTESKKINRIYDFIELEEKWHTVQRPDHLIKFFYPANFTKGKGHEYAIRSFRRALKLNASIRLTFTGNDFGRRQNKIYKQKLLKEGSDLVKEGYVTFSDGVTDIERTIKEHDVLLNFSESESFSMTCYEASYYGVPVIVTDCGGPTEFIMHGISGLIVPKQNVAAMSQSILNLANDFDKRRAMGQRGKTLIQKRIAEEKTLEQYKKMYEF